MVGARPQVWFCSGAGGGGEAGRIRFLQAMGVDELIQQGSREGEEVQDQILSNGNI